MRGGNKSDYLYSAQNSKKPNFRGEKKNKNEEQKTARNLKFSELNKYMNNAQNLNMYSHRMNNTKTKNISLNHYFGLNKISQGKKSINNIYNDINIYHKSFWKRKNDCNLTPKKDELFLESERFKINNSNVNVINIDLEKKKKKLLKLQKILEELKTNQNDIQSELISINKQNLELERSKNTKNNIIYNNIKNIFDNIENKDSNNIYKSLTLTDKCKLLRKIYLEKKLQKSLIEKIYSIYIDSYNTINDGDINAENDYNLHNLLNWVISLVENIDYFNLQDDKIKLEINKKRKEKDLYKIYYNKWSKIFNAYSKEEIIQNINELIKEQNINKNEKIKMIKVLFNKQNS